MSRLLGAPLMAVMLTAMSAQMAAAGMSNREIGTYRAAHAVAEEISLRDPQLP